MTPQGKIRQILPQIFPPQRGNPNPNTLEKMLINGRKIQLKSISHTHTVCQHQGSSAKHRHRGLDALPEATSHEGASTSHSQSTDKSNSGSRRQASEPALRTHAPSEGLTRWPDLGAIRLSQQPDASATLWPAVLDGAMQRSKIGRKTRSPWLLPSPMSHLPLCRVACDDSHGQATETVGLWNTGH